MKSIKKKLYNIIFVCAIASGVSTLKNNMYAMSALEIAGPYATTPGWIVPFKAASDSTFTDKIDLREHSVQKQLYNNSPARINDRIENEYAYLDTWEGNVKPLDKTQLNYVMGEDKTQPISRNPLED